jgi:cytochrome c
MKITPYIFNAVIIAGALMLCLSVNVSAGEIDAAAAQALAKKSNCGRCHGTDKDKDGPSFKKTAAKYKGQAGAEEKLIKHLQSGEKAKFPDGHEEDHTVIKADDPSEIKNLVDWILSL